MTSKRKHQPKIHHTSALTVDRDQSEALRAAKKIFGSLTAPVAAAPKPVTRKKKK